MVALNSKGSLSLIMFPGAASVSFEREAVLCARHREQPTLPCIMRVRRMPGMRRREISTLRLCVTDENWVHQKELLRVKKIMELTFRALGLYEQFALNHLNLSNSKANRNEL